MIDPVAGEPRLTIELVPSTSWYSNVRTNVRKKDWELCKAWARSDCGYDPPACKVCGGRGSRYDVDCHERWSYLGLAQGFAVPTQRLDGLIALCPPCHEVKHIGRAMRVGNYPRALAHLMRVNDWTKADAEQYVDEAMHTWHIRSQVITWDLDLSWLSRELDIR